MSEKLLKFFEKIIHHRNKILVITLILLVVCGFMATKTNINSDIASYLPESSISKQTMEVLREDFNIKGDSLITIEGDLSDYDKISQVINDIVALDDVDNALWLGTYEQMLSKESLENGKISSVNPLIQDKNVEDLTSALYFEQDGKNYYVVNLALGVPNSGGSASVVLDEVNNILQDELSGSNDYYLSGNAMQSKNMIDSALGDLPKFLVVAFLVIAVILLLTNKSIVSSIIFLATIGISIILNMGTNIFTPYISTVTFSVAAILQLALSMDYSIFLTHAFEEFKKTEDDDEIAMAKAMKKTCGIILASALTTIAGFCALFVMKFELGFDLGLCLAKGVTLSFITVLLVQPSLMIKFKKACDKTTHKVINPKFNLLAKMPDKFKYVAVILTVLLFVPAFYFSNQIEYYYVDSHYVDDAQGAQKVAQEIGSQSVFVVPKVSDEQQLELVEKLSTYDNVSGLTGFYPLVSTITKDLSLPIYSSLEQRVPETLVAEIPLSTLDILKFAETGELDQNLTAGLNEKIKGYAQVEAEGLIKQEIQKQSMLAGRMLSPQEQQAIISQVSTQVEQQMSNIINTQINEYKSSMGDFAGQFDQMSQGFFHDVDGVESTYFTLSISGEAEGDEAIATLEKIENDVNTILGVESKYKAGNTQIVRDLSDITKKDFIVVSVLSAILILIILFATFRKVFLPILLVLMIEFAIFINLSISYLMGGTLNFMSYVVISAIQLGATIDYAILFTKNYEFELANAESKVKAAMASIKQSAMSICISMSILLGACLSVYFISGDVIIKEITMLIGRGAFISAIVVLVFLPAILAIGKKRDKTKKLAENQE